MKRLTPLSLGSAAAVALLATPAAAHPGHGNEADLAFSYLHPMGDLENLFLMIMTGVFVLALVRMMGLGDSLMGEPPGPSHAVSRG